LTSIIAAGASFVFWAGKRSRRVRLEQYLKAKTEKSPNELFSVIRLMADLGMTEAEVFSASVASRHVARWVRKDRQTGLPRRFCSNIERHEAHGRGFRTNLPYLPAKMACATLMKARSLRK
jgi:hypothetical protein